MRSPLQCIGLSDCCWLLDYWTAIGAKVGVWDTVIDRDVDRVRVMNKNANILLLHLTAA